MKDGFRSAWILLDSVLSCISYPSLYAGYIVSVRRIVMDRNRLCKIVLLTLAAPRGVTDLYLSWGIIIEHAAYCLHSSWYPLCLHFGFGVLTVGAWVGISLALSSDFSGILLRRWSSNPFCLDFGFWFFCFGLGPCFIGCFALGSSFGGRFGLWPYPWSLDLTMRCGGIYSRLRCFE